MRSYNTDGIPLEMHKVIIQGKELNISYAPIHGPIQWAKKQLALKIALQ